MISAEDIRDARQRAGMTQAELAQRVGVSQRTVGNWERGESIPRNRAARITAALADHLGSDAPPLRSISDAELLAEIARRFERAREQKAGGRDVRSNTAPIATSDDDTASGDAAADAAPAEPPGTVPKRPGIRQPRVPTKRSRGKSGSRGSESRTSGTER